ncbi:MAG: hypothetical protein KUL81_15150 [Azonexus sp.]|nr:hypothetical protein [Azonexus sp.]
MKKSLITASIVAGIFAAGVVGAQAAEQAQLATLSNVNGKVLVNKGNGYVSAKSGTSLGEGDRVISLNGATASVVYEDGCVTQMPENSLLAFDKFTACGKEPFKVASAKQPVQYAQAIGGTMNDGSPVGSGATTDRLVLPGESFMVGAPVTDGISGLLIFGVAAGAAGAYTSHNSNDNPVSPM